MARRFASMRFVMAAMGTLAICQIALADVTVDGVVYELKNGKYEPLGGVQIQAFRNGAPLLANPKLSDDKTGIFSFTVKDGAPFDVLFFGDKRVPELTMIAGNHSGQNHVNVRAVYPGAIRKSGEA